MRCLGVLAVLTVGCSFDGGVPSGTTPGDGHPMSLVDGTTLPADAAPIPIDGCVTFASQVDTCALGSGSAIDLTTGLYVYNTDSNTLFVSDSNGNPLFPVSFSTPHQVVNNHTLDVWVVPSFTLPSDVTLFLRGSVAFGIISAGAVSISGKIDLVGGAGTRGNNACDDAAGQNGHGDNNGGSGGGGGGFQRAGGAGGAGNNDGADAGTAATKPTSVIGGCPGGNGGQGNNSNDNGGNGGNGGGALYIASATSITVGGTINAGGVGGKGGNQVAMDQGNAGGGAGGSGGLIWLEAPLISVTGALAANGGAGGEGSANKTGGHDGNDARADATQASGGTGTNNGGDGGKGDAATDTAGTGASSTSGGGGGGGVGFIIIPGSFTSTGTVTPAAVL